MRWIELHDVPATLDGKPVREQKPVWVNLELATEIHPKADGMGSTIYFGEEPTTVMETPEQIWFAAGMTENER